MINVHDNIPPIAVVKFQIRIRQRLVKIPHNRMSNCTSDSQRYFVQEDLLSHEYSIPKTFCLTNQLFWFRRTIFLRPQTNLRYQINVAALKLQVSGVAFLSVQFLIHASSSICIWVVWRICMMPGAFLMCAASSSLQSIYKEFLYFIFAIILIREPFWKARDFYSRAFLCAQHYERTRLPHLKLAT